MATSNQHTGLGKWRSHRVLGGATLVATAVACSTTLVAGVAVAGDGYGTPRPRPADAAPGPWGKSMLSAEGLFGFASRSIAAKLEGEESVTIRTSGVSLLGGGVAATYLPPRLAYDYTFLSGVTIGGGLGLSVLSGEAEIGESGDTGTEPLPDAASFYAHPRVGFMWGGERFGVHLRTGIVYVSSSTSDGEQDASSWAVPLEAGLLVFLGDRANWAVSATPAYFWGFAGRQRGEAPAEEYSVSASSLSFGLHLFL